MNELKRRLGGDFDIVNEGDHIYLEFDPKTGRKKDITRLKSKIRGQ